MSENIKLPKRAGFRPPTTTGMPHMQILFTPDPEVKAELFRCAYSLPGVSNVATRISVPGARALWLSEDLVLAHEELILVGREFAHIHPDGSLHVTLSPERAKEAIEAQWAEYHPLAQQIGINGMVLLYTPRNMQELDVIFQLIIDSYNFVTGQSIQADKLVKSHEVVM
jgi:phospholipase/carboxylesterase